MRRVVRGLRYVGAYVFAYLVGMTAATQFWRLLGYAFGTLTGAAAVVASAVSLALFVVTTAWAFSIFAVSEPRRRRRLPA